MGEKTHEVNSHKSQLDRTRLSLISGYSLNWLTWHKRSGWLEASRRQTSYLIVTICMCWVLWLKQQNLLQYALHGRVKSSHAITLSSMISQTWAGKFPTDSTPCCNFWSSLLCELEVCNIGREETICCTRTNSLFKLSAAYPPPSMTLLKTRSQILPPLLK